MLAVTGICGDDAGRTDSENFGNGFGGSFRPPQEQIDDRMAHVHAKISHDGDKRT